MVINAGNPDATPPVLPIMEEDSRLRYRTQMALESFTTAGSEQAYLFHTYSASTKVKSSKVDNPKAGEVLITLLSTDGDGTADQRLLDMVRDYVNTDDKRPLTDLLVVQSDEIITYSVNAVVHLY
jgi:phage-related baseplate assembly protein